MQKLSFPETLDQIVAEDGRYDKEAYVFVREALDYTLKLLKKENAKTDSRHVSGQELLEGIRQFALKEYGPMAITLFNSWGVRSCKDFGEIVFNLVEKGILGKTEKDRREDFHEGFDFEQALVQPFIPAATRPSTNPVPRSSVKRSTTPAKKTDAAAEG
ncbi:MAG: hypothetical protein JO317_01255 [Verrucomicrobiae bacterium]|nr:hypothetical protein [Verrucomicrobiae bacterium]